MKQIKKSDMGMEKFINPDIYGIAPAKPVMQTKCDPIPRSDWETPISNKFQGAHNTFRQMRLKAQRKK